MTDQTLSVKLEADVTELRAALADVSKRVKDYERPVPSDGRRNRASEWLARTSGCVRPCRARLFSGISPDWVRRPVEKAATLSARKHVNAVAGWITLRARRHLLKRLTVKEKFKFRCHACQSSGFSGQLSG